VLTVTEAALRASVSVSLIYVWCSDGTLPHIRVGRKGKRGHIRIAEEDLDRRPGPALFTPTPLSC